MRLRLKLFVVVLVLFITIPAWAVGTVVVTTTAVGSGIVKYSITWTSTAGGAVSGNSLDIKRGALIQAQFVPASGGTQPTDAYDALFNDINGVDLLSSAGANLSNATSKLVQFSPPLYYDGTAALDLVIAAAGNAKSGTFILWVGPWIAP